MDRLATALAKLIGPTASQGKLYDRRTRQIAAIQGIQLKILTASQASDPPRAQDRAQSGPGRLEGVATARPAPRSATSPPWNPRSCGRGGPTSSPPIARRVTDA